MQANGKRTTVPTRWSRGKRYTDYIKQDLVVLADARRWLNANAGIHEQSQFTPEESARRVAFDAAQVEAGGHIARWLPAAPPKPKTRDRTRFAFDYALGRHLTARAG